MTKPLFSIINNPQLSDILDMSVDLKFTAHELEVAIAQSTLSARDLEELTEIIIRMNNLKSRINLRR